MLQLDLACVIPSFNPQQVRAGQLVNPMLPASCASLGSGCYAPAPQHQGRSSLTSVPGSKAALATIAGEAPPQGMTVYSNAAHGVSSSTSGQGSSGVGPLETSLARMERETMSLPLGVQASLSPH